MKKVSLLFFMFIALGFTACENDEEAGLSTDFVAEDGKYPAMKFEEAEYDFGQIKDGEVVAHVFEFKNTGEAPLLITDARASCGCTVPEYPKEPIAPGESGRITVKFDSKGKVGMQRKTVTIVANTNPINNDIHFTAEVLENN